MEKIKKLHQDQSARLINSKVPFLNQGHNMVYNVQKKDIDILKEFLKNKAITDVLIRCLNDEWYRSIPKENPNYILRSMLARSGGGERMPLHIDSFIPNSGKICWSV